MLSRSLAVLVAVALCGCAGSQLRDMVQPRAPTLSDPAEVAAALRPLFCEGRDQCEAYWRLAQVWIARNSRWRIDTLSDALIVTFIAPRPDRTLSYRVTREPQTDGRERIAISIRCNDAVLGCLEDPLTRTLQFKRAINPAH